MFKSGAIYKSEGNVVFRILTGGDTIEGFTTCVCCGYTSSHYFDLNGKSLCAPDPRCKEHGDLVEKIDTSGENYSIKETKYGGK